MAFSFPQPVYNLDFSETRLAGLEIRVKSVSIAEYMEVLEMTMISDEFLNRLLATIVSWNVERGGKQVKPSLDELKRLDPGSLRLVNVAWLTAIGGVSEELGKGSGNGEAAQEDLMQGLASSSQSLGS